MLFSMDHSNPKITLKKTVQRSLAAAQTFKCQAVEQVSNKINLIKDNRLPAEAQQSLDMNNLFAGLQTQNSSHFWCSLNGLAKKRVADRMRGPAIIRYQPEETVKRTRVIVCCHKCTFALAPDQHVLSSHFIDGFANGSLTDIESCRQLPFTRYRIAWPPLALLQTTDQEILNLTIEGAESWRT